MPQNPHAHVWEQFRRNTDHHILTVQHDAGLYRHLTMAEPGTGIWSWSVMTWPGRLWVGGDIGQGFVWSRVPDMLDFFDTSGYGDYYGDGSPFLQHDYWAEKLDRACSDHSMRYSPERFLRLVKERLQDHVDDEDIPAARAAEMNDEARFNSQTEYEAMDWLRGQPPLLDDWWEWDLKDYDHAYILALYAVTTTVRAQRASESEV